MVSFLCAVLYWVFLILGIIAAYKGDWVVAMFFAITCAGESIAVSIDHWPKLNKKLTVNLGDKMKMKNG